MNIKILTLVLCFIMISCAVITVNIYFPEKDVKEAYQLLEKELMGTEGKPEEKVPEGKPESLLHFEIVPSAYAQEAGLPEKLSSQIKKMPDVVNAYSEMGKRLSDINRLRDDGIVGEGNNGLLVVREGTLSPGDKKLIESENENRKTVMNGMAKAMLRVNRDKETDETLRKVKPQAVEYFAALRRDTAKKGWWIQDPSGNWSKK